MLGVESKRARITGNDSPILAAPLKRICFSSFPEELTEGPTAVLYSCSPFPQESLSVLNSQRLQGEKIGIPKATIMTPMSNDPAEARKRRKEIIQSQRSENELVANGAAALAPSGSVAAASLTSSSTSTVNGASAKIPIIGASAEGGTNTATTEAGGNGIDKKPPKKRKVATGDTASRKNGKKNSNGTGDANKSKKTQIRYDPDVPMSKDQLAAWRREARRVRNRESAAASRQRIRNRISELEDEVGEWKAKYSEAIQRLEALEKCISENAAGVGQQQQQKEEQELQQNPPQQVEEPQGQSTTETMVPTSNPANQTSEAVS